MKASVRHVGQWSGAALMALLFLAACAVGPWEGSGSDALRPQISGIRRGGRIAVLPLENLTPQPNAGLVAAELISTEIYRRGLFDQVEPSRARNQLVGAKIDLDRLSDASTAQKAGEMLGVEAVLVGSVAEYGYMHGLREEPTFGTTLRLVSAKDGTVLWAQSAGDVGTFPLVRESVVEVAHNVIVRLIDNLSVAMGTAR